MLSLMFVFCFFFECVFVGGLGFNLHEIGIVLSVVGVLLLPVSLFGFLIVRTAHSTAQQRLHPLLINVHITLG